MAVPEKELVFRAGIFVINEEHIALLPVYYVGKCFIIVSFACQGMEQCRVAGYSIEILLLFYYVTLNQPRIIRRGGAADDELVHGYGYQEHKDG